MIRPIDLAMIIASILLGALISFGLALLGEPQSVWLWRDIFGMFL